MTERNKFQELLETIKKYKDNVTDYAYSTQVGGRSSPDKTRNYSYSKETYEISSPELKKEARKIIFGEDKAGDGGLYRLGLSPDSGNTFYSYEKGDGSQPDKFEIEFNPERRRKEKEQIDREQRRRDREQAERDRQQVERDRKEKQNSPDSFSFRDKKCAECGQEIDFTKGIIRSKPDRQEE
ncbi:2570_t:CDS:1 [Ambispora leptoticha]|uniref:2570_t:CDS:1 n=1 Tax=Ambispora leptoticha TaxID=144679 RepID=A0A9N9EW19_9GLOM|nr:2570_t:CDS:1 [Ambispora leptoticha]